MSDPSDRIYLPNTDSSSSFSSFYNSNNTSSKNNHFMMNNDVNNDNNYNHFNNSQQSSSPSSQQQQNLKEAGIIEKLLVSYGFIQCCERQARLFFHFSQYLGNIDHLKIGDPVEYETSYDRRTGKPVAINIKKITSNDFMTKMSKTERLSGVIATEITNDREGRVAFENMGEFFFLPFNHEDCTDNITFKANDKVTFVLTTDDSGNFRATSVQFEPSNLTNNQGVISAIKDTFGFIERSDSMTKIFFHSTDCNDFKSLVIGDFVQFNITTRKNKELAINVAKLATTDEEFSEKIYQGKVLKYNNRSNFASGTVFCPELKKEFVFYEKDVKGSFTLNPSDLVTFQIATDRRTHYERIINIIFLNETFIINSEPRERGYVASLRELYGFIKCPSKEGSLIYFKFTELLDPKVVLKLNDEVEFTFITDAQSKKCQAIRISIIPNGTIFNNILSKKPSSTTTLNNNGENNSSQTNINISETNHAVQEDFNLIDLNYPTLNDDNNQYHLRHGHHLFNNNSTEMIKDTHDNGISSKLMIMMNGTVDKNGALPSSSSQTQSNWTKELMAIFQKNNDNEQSSSSMPGLIGNGHLMDNNTLLVNNHHQNDFMFNSLTEDNLLISNKKSGIIVVLKDNFGFIESLDGENEYFFHITSYNNNDMNDEQQCRLGQAVEFETFFTNGKWKALNVTPMMAFMKPFMKHENDLSETLIGTVVRTLQMFDNDQKDYTGLIQLKLTKTENSETILTNGWNNMDEYEFSMISLKFLKDYISVGDTVRFQVATNPVTKKKRAYNLEVVRDRLKGTILSLQRMFGFLKPDNLVFVGNIYFNAAEIRQNVRLKSGDRVDFYLIKNKKTDKYYAIDINKLDLFDNGSNAAGLPLSQVDRTLLKNFLNKCQNAEKNGPKVIAIRQPRAPDGTKGFSPVTMESK